MTKGRRPTVRPAVSRTTPWVRRSAGSNFEGLKRSLAPPTTCPESRSTRLPAMERGCRPIAMRASAHRSPQRPGSKGKCHSSRPLLAPPADVEQAHTRTGNHGCMHEASNRSMATARCCQLLAAQGARTRPTRNLRTDASSTRARTARAGSGPPRADAEAAWLDETRARATWL